MLHSALAVAAALIGAAFALSTFERWLTRRRRHEAAWSAALALFALAALALAAGAGLGWTGPAFRAFYLFGAIVNVPVLALGTVYLHGGARTGDRAALGVAAFCLFAAGVLAVAPFTAAIPRDTLVQGSKVFGPAPRILAAVGSGVGALVIFGGAAWSAWRARRGPRRLLVSNALIAAGTALLSASGLLNSVLDEMSGFAVMLALGITVLFAGYLVATAASPVDATAPASGAAVTTAAAPAATASRPSPAGARSRT